MNKLIQIQRKDTICCVLHIATDEANSSSSVVWHLHKFGSVLTTVLLGFIFSTAKLKHENAKKNMKQDFFLPSPPFTDNSFYEWQLVCYSQIARAAFAL
jgi:hypothetical protein